MKSEGSRNIFAASERERRELTPRRRQNGCHGVAGSQLHRVHAKFQHSRKLDSHRRQVPDHAQVLNYQPHGSSSATNKTFLTTPFLQPMNPATRLSFQFPYSLSYARDWCAFRASPSSFTPEENDEADRRRARNAMTPRTKMIVLNSASNPCGRFARRRGELQRLAT